MIKSYRYEIIDYDKSQVLEVDGFSLYTLKANAMLEFSIRIVEQNRSDRQVIQRYYRRIVSEDRDNWAVK